MAREVLFLTSTNLACNPRCLKEVRLMRRPGVNITVVAFHLHNWTDAKEAELNTELKDVRFHYLEAGRRPLIPWLQASLLEKSSRLVQPLFPAGIRTAAFALSKRSWSLLKWVKGNKKRYDLIIAHNPPAFYPAAWLAARSGSPFALDVEDYHPGEGSSRKEHLASAVLMEKLLNKAAYVSFASPLIKTYSERLPGVRVNSNFVVINNTFPHSDFSRPEVRPGEEKLRIVWFSQFVDYGRGLEKILPILDAFRDKIQLTLIGSPRELFLRQELAGREYIRHLPSMPQDQLHRELSNYDVGLALEDGTVDLNRKICLTNKIWSYLLAGNYILASDTEAQRAFITAYKGAGVCCSISYDAVNRTITDMINTRESIRADSPGRFERAVAAGWEKESQILVNQWRLLVPEPEKA